MKSTPRVLLVDDDPEFCELMKVLMDRLGFSCVCFSSPVAALDALQNDFDLSGCRALFCDVNLPVMSGPQFCTKIKPFIGNLPVILITAQPSLDSALWALRESATAYLQKPISSGELKRTLEKLPTSVTNSFGFTGFAASSERVEAQLIGKSRPFKSLLEVISRVGDTDASVLITGESGTGKELVARAIHCSSSRRDQPFIAFNCAAIPEHLLESELFGHAKGAFTGAVSRHRGLFEQASGGTIFLDEIGDMPLALQAKLLRVLQELLVRPLGETKLLSIDVRVISATHQDLFEHIRSGKFREDLYFRLNVIPIRLAPLRERRDDIPLLAEHFLREVAGKHRPDVQGITMEAVERLCQHGWPGNIRELKNLLERSVLMSKKSLLGPDDLVFDEITARLARDSNNDRIPTFPDDQPLREIEKGYILHILKKAGGVRDRAAKILAIDRKTLYRKEQGYGMYPIGPEINPTD